MTSQGQRGRQGAGKWNNKRASFRTDSKAGNERKCASLKLETANRHPSQLDALGNVNRLAAVQYELELL